MQQNNPNSSSREYIVDVITHFNHNSLQKKKLLKTLLHIISPFDPILRCATQKKKRFNLI